ncbi:hypothetical protein GCM10022279_03800 [Comamonas faecalis]|uniref:DUF3025 domain-containing protein n=2 Tax=Comamonas faecalis TaxID=1387849 RepID=A0ABP7QJN9_9BURK
MMHTIDWQMPWLAPIAGLGKEVAHQVQSGTSVADALNALVDTGQAPDPGVRFVPQAGLPPGMAYEQFIFERAQVPTRDNLHDFFNGLVWLHHPQAKRRMSQIHGSAVAAQGVGATRGPLRDALTLLDENGALLLAPDALWQALAARQWQRLFIDLRPLWRQARLVLVGHALMEKLVMPRKPMVTHVYRPPPALAVPPDAPLDAWLAAALDAGHLRTKPFAPLPVLGVPGWWPDNENFLFYADSAVFRPARQYTGTKV